MRYQQDANHDAIHHIIYVAFTQTIVFDEVDILQLGATYLWIPYDCSHALIPYGLALRGVV